MDEARLVDDDPALELARVGPDGDLVHRDLAAETLALKQKKWKKYNVLINKVIFYPFLWILWPSPQAVSQNDTLARAVKYLLSWRSNPDEVTLTSAPTN